MTARLATRMIGFPSGDFFLPRYFEFFVVVITAAALAPLVWCAMSAVQILTRVVWDRWRGVDLDLDSDLMQRMQGRILGDAQVTKRDATVVFSRNSHTQDDESYR